MRTTRLVGPLGVVIVLGVLASGCVVPRALEGPTSFVHEDRPYIYFVEQEQMRDSRIKKCDIGDKNTVACKTQYDLE